LLGLNLHLGLHGSLHLSLPSRLHFRAEFGEVVHLLDLKMSLVLQVVVVFVDIADHNFDYQITKASFSKNVIQRNRISIPV